MKRALLTMLALTLWLAMVSGATMSYFTAHADGGIIPFTTGTVEVNGNAQSVIGSDNWVPSVPVNVAWVLQNIGTKQSFVRAKVEPRWIVQTGTTGSTESAWAGLVEVADTDPNYAVATRGGGGNAARRFTIASLPRTIVLAYGSNQVQIGTAAITKDDTFLYVSLHLNQGWRVVESKDGYEAHLDISDDLTKINSSPGKMKFNRTFLPTLNTFKVRLTDIDVSKTMYAAIHLAVAQVSSNTEVLSGYINTTWASLGNWAKGTDDYWYYCGPVAPNQAVPLSFSVTLNTLNLPGGGGTLLGADYTVDLTVEAIQVTNGAVTLWPNRPTHCLP